MTRPLRLEVADGIYHVTARGNEGRSIFRDPTDRKRFLELLATTCERFRWQCLAYCQMTNHYHLLVRTPEPNLARGMRDLNGVYAQAFNRRHGRVGHLFQGRYRGILVEAEEQLLTVVAYIVRNPVRAGMCESPAHWLWSSHEATMGARPPEFVAVGELLRFFDDDRKGARRAYCELVESRLPTNDVHGNGVIVGSDDFLTRHLRGVVSCPEIPAGQRRVVAPPLAELVIEKTVEAIALAYASGYTMPAIARQLGVHTSTVSRRLSRYRAQIKT